VPDAILDTIPTQKHNYFSNLKCKLLHFDLSFLLYTNFLYLQTFPKKLNNKVVGHHSEK